MPRGRKRVVEMTASDIKARIESNTAKIDELTNEIKSLKVENKNPEHSLRNEKANYILIIEK